MPLSEEEQIQRVEELLARFALKNIGLGSNWLNVSIKERDEFLLLVGRADRSFNDKPRPDVLQYTIARGLSQLSSSDGKRALTNALGYGQNEQEQLAGRRREYGRQTDLSERTIIRHERKGAHELATLMVMSHETRWDRVENIAADTDQTYMRPTLEQTQAALRAVVEHLNDPALLEDWRIKPFFPSR